MSHAWVGTGPLRYDPTAVERDIANLRAAVASADVVDTFLPVVAPASAYWLVNEYYASEEEFVFAWPTSWPRSTATSSTRASCSRSTMPC